MAIKKEGRGSVNKNIYASALSDCPGRPLIALSGEIPDPAVVDGSSGVGLIRSEYLVRSSGSYWLKSECREHVANYVAKVMHRMGDRPVWYRLSDLQARDINVLDGCDMVHHDDNPILGPRGLRRATLSTVGLDYELATVVGLSSRYPYLGLVLPFCRDADNVAFGISKARNAGYDGPLGVMFEVPAAILQAREIMALGIDYCLVGLNDLTGLMLGAARGAPDFDRAHPTIINLVRALYRDAREAGVAFAVGGNYDGRVIAAFADLPASAFTVHYSDWSILVDVDLGEYEDMNLARTLRRRSDEKLVAAGVIMPKTW